jgi:hypothetical protein
VVLKTGAMTCAAELAEAALTVAVSDNNFRQPGRAIHDLVTAAGRPDTDADADTDTGTGTDTDADADAGTDTGTGTDTDASGAPVSARAASQQTDTSEQQLASGRAGS